MTETIVQLKQVSKQYSMLTSQSKQLLSIFKSPEKKPSFFALRDVTFEVKKGETVGLIGLNGSGKSTLSNILAGIILPTYGEMSICGEVSLLAIGAGLKPTLSGIENIRMKCLMLGYSTQEIEHMIPAITEFADLQSFIHQPIKRYSSGMKARLGFAIAVQIDPDILIIDEALAVGDTTFYKKCTDKIAEFQAAGKTIFFVSHSLSQVQNLCDRIIWIHYGEVRLDGPAQEVGLEYSKFVHRYNKLSKEDKQAYQTNLKKRQMNTIHGKDKPTFASKKEAKSYPLATIMYLGSLWLLVLVSAIFMESSHFATKVYEIIASFWNFS
ncbi:ABC transporter ATP-binding protein [Listeria booriae]|uniref:ABC transporter ATP-binding protein n=1 Tax=Listeria booriae TaxID=1552123 RepID=A0A7X0Y0N3_9LIST|nr:ABC transporter ATP-binding protein [Listeria booriae]MBC1794797.1 ABC transporter ATP-binding protein [Listeria booriae]MBC1797963.1 ABC transporter ATP-binding protein [Listeria booriae]MBC1804087.1 ABC transporter ATP-binding protein [Listeria booriae]